MRARSIKFAVYSAITLVQCTAAPVLYANPPVKISRLLPWTSRDHGKKPHTASDAAIEELAKNIDWLENRLNLYGTVVAKSPDVWGEARLTAHRQEFEEVLKQQLNSFPVNDSIQGSEYVNDQAFLAFAMSMKGATPEEFVSPPGVSVTSTTTSASDSKADPNTTTSISTFFQGPPTGFSIAKSGDGGINMTLERTQYLDQLARYVNHLHATRRINEGDDTSDSPGYAMNLVRIPVSVMPGHHTKVGFGAEISVIATPYLGDELLPVAFKDFVINDVIDQLALPIARYINSDPKIINMAMLGYTAYKKAIRQLDENLGSINSELHRNPKIPFFDISDDKLAKKMEGYKGPKKYFGSKGEWKKIEVSRANLEEFVLEIEELNRHLLCENGNSESGLSKGGDANREVDLKGLYEKLSFNIDVVNESSSAGHVSSEESDDRNKKTGENDVKRFLSKIDDLRRQIARSVEHVNSSSPTLPTGTGRKARLPFPSSQLICNYGQDNTLDFLELIHSALRTDLLNKEVVHVTDVQAFLREELNAAYELLSQPAMAHWWDTIPGTWPTSLAEDIRLRRTGVIEYKRSEFINSVHNCNNDLVPCNRDSSAASLAWVTFVSSQLLNERLNQDIRETMGTKATGHQHNEWLPFYGPNPPQEARIAFNDYVAVRWPIKVFALDPNVNEQNIADVRSLYRQMQMAVAMAFASRDIGLSAAMQSMRKLQRDRATIDLNRTAVAFGHGDDTFGWKFYPRFQTQPVQGNASAFFRDMFIGGPTDKQLERTKEIEPGMRECTAIVLMPSFVPHVTFTTRTNWFKLGKQGVTADSITDTMEFSRAIRKMETLATECVNSPHLYRDGEVERLLARVKQLDRKLPLQTLECQVPIENALGGFEIFSSGTRELAPELHGWYGAPGYDPSRGSRLFLSGESFNVSQTKLIIGGQEVPFRLLSRQVMEVSLPPGLAVIRDRALDDLPSESYLGYVDAQIATPYGISGHLLIPVLREQANYVLAPAVDKKEVFVTAKIKNKAVDGYAISPSQSFVEIFVPDNPVFSGQPLKVRSKIISTVDNSVIAIDQREMDLVRFASNKHVLTFATLATEFPPSSVGSSVLGNSIKNHIGSIVAASSGNVAPLRYHIVFDIVIGSSSVPVAGEVVLVVDLKDIE